VCAHVVGFVLVLAANDSCEGARSQHPPEVLTIFGFESIWLHHHDLIERQSAAGAMPIWSLVWQKRCSRLLA
jgi:hypothetical protein